MQSRSLWVTIFTFSVTQDANMESFTLIIQSWDHGWKPQLEKTLFAAEVEKVEGAAESAELA
jgi:hypothetical protein